MSVRVGDLGAQVRGLYLVAMAVFVLTVGIGILNGSDAVAFSRDWILTHVHSGTLGWITLSVAATAFWFFGAGDRRLATALAVLIPIYVLAFASGNLTLRAVTGVALLVVVLWLFVWVWSAFRAGPATLGGLAITLGVTTFTYGAVLGVLLQVQFALGTVWLTGDGIGAHAAAMAFGYLVLFTMGVVEWRLLGTRDLPRAGLVQVGALFAGGLILSLGLLAGASQAAGGLYLLTQIVAVIAFVVRVWPTALRVSWATASPRRGIAIASVWVVLALLLIMYLIVLFIGAAGDISAIPTGVLVAGDHAVFIGVLTNVILAMVALLSSRGADRWSWADQVVFWGVNLGLAVFVVGLVAESAEIKRIGAPVMGIAILLGLGVYAARLLPQSAADIEQAIA